MRLCRFIYVVINSGLLGTTWYISDFEAGNIETIQHLMCAQQLLKVFVLKLIAR